jgi:hypothetical protein
MSIDELKKFLSKYDIPLSEWRKGEAKTLNHLAKEIQEDECSLVEADGFVHRMVSNGVAAHIFYEHEGVRFKLVEEKQVFKDGRERVRGDIRTSIGEKMKSDESKDEAIIRAFQEELGIDPDFEIKETRPIVKGPVPSVSYPGIWSTYRFWIYMVNLPERHFKSDGYIEEQEDKTSYFVWKEY